MNYKLLLPIAIIILFVSITGYYNLQQSIGFGDEPYYRLMTKAIIDNNWIIPHHIPGLFDSTNNTELTPGAFLEKPPLGYYIVTVFSLFPVIANSYSVIFAALTMMLVYWFINRRYGYEEAVISMSCFLVVPLFSYLSVISYLETVTAFFIVLAGILIWETFEKPTWKLSIISGVCLGLAFLVKEIAFILVVPILLLMYLDKSKIKYLLLILLIGSLMFVPHAIRDYTYYGNPVYPAMEGVLGTQYHDQLYYQQRAEFGFPFSFYYSILTLMGNYGIILFVSFIAAIYLLLNKSKLSGYIVSIMIMLVSLIIFVSLPDIRYMFPLIPFSIILIGMFFNKLRQILSKSNFKYLFVGVLIVLIAFGSLTVIGQSQYGKATKDRLPNLDDFYRWIKYNTPEDSVFMTIYTPELVYHTGRKGIFANVNCCGDLLHFYEQNETVALETMRMYNIDYIVLELWQYQFSYDQIKYFAWAYTPPEFLEKVIGENWIHFKPIYNDGYKMIIEVVE